MRTSLLLIAASGLAREVLGSLVGDTNYEVIGILDDEPSLVGTALDGVGVLGSLERVTDFARAQVLMCAGRGSARAAIRRRLSDLGVDDDRFATVVDASVRIPRSCIVGAGSILLAQTTLTADVHVGRHVVAMPQVTITHDGQIGDYATLCAGVSLGGGVRVGEQAYLGMNSTVRENLVVGDGAVLGMGAALLRDLPPRQTWAGVPARSVKRIASNPIFPRNFETETVR